MATYIRLHRALMIMMLLVSMIPFFWASDVGAFQSFAPSCDITSVGGKDQKGLISTIRYCLSRDQRASFYNIYWLDKSYQNSIFRGLPNDHRELIFILNGIDMEFLNDRLKKGSDFYNEHQKILSRNKLRLSQILSKSNVKNLSKSCMNLISNIGCYEEARTRLGLPHLNEIKFMMLHLSV